MFRNKEIRRLFVCEIIFFVVALFLSEHLYSLFLHHYEQKRIEENAYIVGALIEVHPELESEIIQALENYSGDYKEGMEILERYNLSHVEGIGDLESTQVSRTFYYSIHFILVTGIFLALGGIYFLFTRRYYQKIQEMNRYLNDVLAGRETLDIREYDEGDISSLKNDIYKITNILKEQKENANKDKMNLTTTLSDISHQLKTPLTSMYVINDLLLDEKISETQKKELLAKNKNQLERIEWLVTSLLKVSRLDSGMVELKPENVNLFELITRVLEPLQIPMELKNQTLVLEGDKNLSITLDENWTREAILNIVKNAHEHTEEGGIIKISLEDNPLYALISIEDNGSGIKKEELSHIFERFYKGSSGNKDSIGIGLNMAKMIIEKQHGEIHVKSIEGIGTTFEIKFYKNII